jgi:HEPN domain-containing protein
MLRRGNPVKALQTITCGAVLWELVDRKELQELSRIRLKEAKSLLQAGLSDGAYYLAGYAVECALKACIAKATRRSEFPDKRKADDSYSHNLKQLVRVASLDAHLSEATLDPEFKNNWDVTQAWSEQSRYGRHRRESAEALLEAVSNGRHGVIAWIKLHW